jgi:hypothetical protein
MATWRTRCGVVLAGACVLSACEGGQTGQPTIGSSCESAFLAAPADQPFKGVSPRELADAFVGSYTAPLVWRADSGEQVGATDEITIAITYSGDDGSVDMACGQTMRVGVGVDITTRDSGLHASGTVDLVAALGALAPARIDFDMAGLVLGADLRVAAGMVVISGTLQATELGTPSGSARFSAEPLGSAGAAGSNDQ